MPAKMNFSNLRQNDITPYRLFALNFVLIALILYQLGSLTITIPTLVGQSKTVQIDKIGVVYITIFCFIFYTLLVKVQKLLGSYFI